MEEGRGQVGDGRKTGQSMDRIQTGMEQVLGTVENISKALTKLTAASQGPDC